MTDARNARDRGLERLLRESLPAEAGGAACLDADTVAAWVENGLTARERAAAEAHAAGCARCQSMLAVMSRTAPDDAAVQGSMIRRWTMMFAPALTAAAAVALWFALDQPQPTDAPVPAATGSASSRVGDPPVVPSPSRAEPAPPADAPMIQAARKEAELTLADALRKSEAREQTPAMPAEPQSAASRRAMEEKSLGKDGRTGMPAGARAPAAAPEMARPAPAAAPAPPPLGGLAERVDVQTPPAQARQDERARQAPPQQAATQAPPQQAAQQLPNPQQSLGYSRDAAAPQPRTETDAAARAGAVAGRGAAAEAPQVNALRSAAAKTQEPLAFRSADGDGWWRITGARIVEASTDKGATWSSRFAVDEKSVLTAGSAPSSSIVWIVGRAGLVLVTTDGRTFRRAAFPEAADVIAVTAVDARHASVITADGRLFATADGGATWTRK